MGGGDAGGRQREQLFGAEKYFLERYGWGPTACFLSTAFTALSVPFLALAFAHNDRSPESKALFYFGMGMGEFFIFSAQGTSQSAMLWYV